MFHCIHTPIMFKYVNFGKHLYEYIYQEYKGKKTYLF